MSAVRQLIKRVSSGADAVVKPRRGVTVLIYHRVGRRTSVEVDLPTALFDEQMAYLREQHHRVVDLDTAVTALDAPVPTTPPKRSDDPVVVTFDDGTADFADEAVPVLEKHGIPATLYVATDFLERQVEFPDDGTPLSWSALKDTLSTDLVTVGSHTHTHALLDRIEDAKVADELDRSIDLVGEHLGVTPLHFAYPKALPGSAHADREVRRRFRSAALAETRANPYGGTDVFRLWRSPIQVSDGMQWFRAKAAGGMHVEDAVRRTVNRVRYRGADS